MNTEEKPCAVKHCKQTADEEQDSKYCPHHTEKLACERFDVRAYVDAKAR